ncbi:hypothetical protein [Paenibacillus gorillae]|uniref:hypothetical protein n=1 Tax=Paenibacillus gorillae TaxID=1243662 RepID=UPI0004B68A8F|nr:hypothetical protein [Paenibacillus gorillae]
MKFFKSVESKISVERVSLLLFAASICFICFYIFNYGFTNQFNSDSATANLLAEDQVITKSFFPHTWYYYQDIWITAINNYIVLINGFVNDELLSRSIAVLIQTLILAVVTYQLVFKIFNSRVSAFISLAIIFSGISNLFIDMYFGQAAYANITICIMVSLYISLLLLDDKVYSKARMAILFCLFSLMLIILNMSGLRYAFIFTIPLVASIILYGFLDNIKKPSFNKKILLC